MADQESTLSQYASDDEDVESGPNEKTNTRSGGQELQVKNPEELKALARRAEAQHEASLQVNKRENVRTHVSPSRTVHSPEPAAFRVTSSSGRTLNADEVNADSMVHIGSERLDMGIAERVGLVERDSNGKVTLTAKGKKYGGLEDGDLPAASDSPNASTNTADKTPSTPESVKLDNAVANAEAAMVDIPAGVLAGAKARFVEGTADMGGLAEQLGITEEQAGRRYATATAGYQAEANAHLATRGIDDPQAFADYCQSHRIEEFRAAVTQHLRGDLSGYDALAAKFARVDASLSQQDLSAYEGQHDLNGETVNVRTVNGTTWVQGPSLGKVTLRSAILKGLIEVDE
jgi:hypothetical protein